jgi:hypothetical protein
VLSRPRYGRCAATGEDGATAGAIGNRYGSRTRILIGTFGKTAIAVPRARLATTDRKTTVAEPGAAALSAAHARWPPVRSRHDQPQKLRSTLLREFYRRFLDRAQRRQVGLAGHQAHFCRWIAEKNSNRAAQDHRLTKCGRAAFRHSLALPGRLRYSAIGAAAGVP